MVIVTAGDHRPGSDAFSARTSTVKTSSREKYISPRVYDVLSPSETKNSSPPGQLRRPLYPVMGEPPSLAGAGPLQLHHMMALGGREAGRGAGEGPRRRAPSPCSRTACRPCSPRPF